MMTGGFIQAVPRNSPTRPNSTRRVEHAAHTEIDTKTGWKEPVTCRVVSGRNPGINLGADVQLPHDPIQDAMRLSTPFGETPGNIVG